MTNLFAFDPSSLGRFSKFPSALPDGATTVQVSRTLTERNWQELADLFRTRPEVQLRVWGGTSDLEFLKHFPFLKRLLVNTILDLESLEGLRYVENNLQVFGMDPGLRPVSLEPLRYVAASLRSLVVGSPVRKFNTISEMEQLRLLGLGSITIKDPEVFAPLKKLVGFELTLGGTRDLSFFSHLPGLQEIEMHYIRGLEDLTPLEDVTALSKLTMQSLRRVTRLPNFERTNLESLYMENMKGISELSPLLNATKLARLALVAFGHLQPEVLAPLRSHPLLSEATLGFGSDRKNKAAEEILPLAPLTAGRRLEIDINGEAYWKRFV